MATLPLTPAQQQNAVSALYIALFNRAPDAAGFTFWVDGLASGATLSATINAFLASPEARAIYTVEQTPEQFVAAFYETVFGRDADAGGLVYWTDVLNTATANDPETARAVLVTLIIETVSTSLPVKPEGLSDELYAQTVADRDLFGKKVVAGLGYAIDEQGNDLDAAKKVIADLTAPTTPEPGPTPSPGPVTPPPPPPPPGETFVLEPGATDLIGTNGNDIFNAGLTEDEQQTLRPGARIDGGAGTDTLLATLNESLNGSGVFTPRLTNIEIIKVTALADADNSFNLSNSSGFTHVGSDKSDIALTFTSVGNAALSISNQTADVAFAGSTATKLSLTLAEVGTVDTPINVMLAYPGYESQSAKATTYNIVATDAYARLSTGKDNAAANTVTVAAEGRNQLALIDTLATSVTTLTVTGKGSVDFSGQTLSALTTFTAGDGGVTLVSDNATADALTIRSGAGDDTITANGGSIKSLQTGAGNDRVILNGALGSKAVVDLGAGDDWLFLDAVPSVGAVIDGGAGRDTLSVNNASFDYATINAARNFEVLAIRGDGINVDVGRITAPGMTDFLVTNIGATSFTNAKSTSKFEIALDAGAVTIANRSGETATDITLKGGGGRVMQHTDLNVGKLDVTGITTVSLTSNRFGDTGGNYIDTLVHDDGTTITVKGDTDLTFALRGTNQGSTVDATGFTGNLHVTGTAFSDTIIGGDGDDIIQSGDFTTATAGGVTETAVVTWGSFTSGSEGTQSVGGMTIRYNGEAGSYTADTVAAVANGETRENLSIVAQPTDWTVRTGPTSGTSIFESTTPNKNVDDLMGASISGSGTHPNITARTQGQAGVAATNGSTDTLTGGGGANTFVFNTPDADSTAPNITAIITDFVPGTDRIQISGGGGGVVSNSTLVNTGAPSADLATLLAAANSALDGTVKYFLGELLDERDVSSTYLVTDDDGIGYTNVIELTGVALSDFLIADLMAPL